MNINEISVAQLDFLVNNSKRGHEYGIIMIKELLRLEILSLLYDSDYIKSSILKFNSEKIDKKALSEESKFVLSTILKYEAYQKDKDNIKMPPLTPLYLLERLYYEHKQSWSKFKKDFVIEGLVKLGYLKKIFGVFYLKTPKAIKVRNEWLALTSNNPEKLKNMVNYGDMASHLSLLPVFQTHDMRLLDEIINSQLKRSFWHYLNLINHESVNSFS